MSPGPDPRHHLLWHAIVRHLDEGRGDDAALFAGPTAVSYARLAAAAARGARELDERFAPGSRILVAARDQLHVGLAFVAALASRSVPLLADPTSAGRLARLASEWRAAGAIVGDDLREAITLPVLAATATGSWLGAGGAERLALPAVSAEEPAFWTFTSGTTGEPKAVVHAHRGPAAACEAFAQGVLRLGPEDVTISTGGLPFVYVLGNSFLFPLMAGAATILPPDLLLPTVLGELARHGATILVSGPWSLAAIARSARRPRWVESLRRLRCVLSAGESLPARLFEQWRRRFGKELLDNLGSTEMFNSFLANAPGDARGGSLGRPVPGFEIRVGGGLPVPAARGALEVRGASRAVAVGSGSELAPVTGEWCDTGDEVAVDGEGRFLFLGRSDDRFKVKGQFVHPLEVERRLLEVSGVRECLVVPGADEEGLATVVARIVASGGAERDDLARRILRHARRSLSSFQVPARLEWVETLPRSARGKLERPRAL